MPLRPCLGSLVGLAALFLAATPVQAGSLCGTVRDAQTQAPVAQAGFFLFDSSGTYTGHHTASDVDGSYCLADVPEGTYTLQVRRDDYLIAVIEGIVIETATTVDVEARTTVLFAAPYPNPSTAQVSLLFRAPAGDPIRLEVFDAAGRRVRAWSGRGNGIDRIVHFDLRDHRGRRLASGIYTVRLVAHGQTITRSLTLVR